MVVKDTSLPARVAQVESLVLAAKRQFAQIAASEIEDPRKILTLDTRLVLEGLDQATAGLSRITARHR